MDKNKVMKKEQAISLDNIKVVENEQDVGQGNTKTMNHKKDNSKVVKKEKAWTFPWTILKLWKNSKTFCNLTKSTDPH